MFRPLLNSARRTAVQSARRHASSSHGSASSGGDTKWLISAVAITVPSLAYLLSPPDKKAQAHKVAHVAAAHAGVSGKTPEEAAESVPDEVHGPSSNASQEGKSQTPESQRKQSADTAHLSNSESAKAGNASVDHQGKGKESGEGREVGATTPTGGDIGSKQSGLSNTQTKHMVPAVIKDGENPTAKSSNTVAPHNPRGQEKEGDKADADAEEEPPQDEAEADDE